MILFIDLKQVTSVLSLTSYYHIFPVLYFLVNIFYILFKFRKSTPYRFYLLINLLLLIKHIAEFFLQGQISSTFGIILFHSILFYLIFSPVAFLAFSYSLSNTISNKVERNNIKIFIFLGTILFVITFIFKGSLYKISFINQDWIYHSLVSLKWIFLYFFLSILTVIYLSFQSYRLVFNRKYNDRLFYLHVSFIFLSLYILRFTLPSYVFIITDMIASIILFYLSSLKSIWSIKNILQRVFVWFFMSSIPIIPLSFFSYIIIINQKYIPNFAILLAFISFFYLLFYYFRYFQSSIDFAFSRTVDNFTKNLNEYKSQLILTFSTTQLIQNVHKLIGQNFQVTHYGILTWNDSQGAFTPIGIDEPPDRLLFRVYNTFFLWLTEQNRVFVKEEFLFDEKLSSIKASAISFFERTESSLMVPFVLNKAVLAVLFLGNKLDGSRFTKNEKKFLFDIMDFTSISLSNAGLYERLGSLNLNLEKKVSERTRELEDAQGQLVQSEKLASLGVMVAGIAHEINTPAGVINGSIENISNNFFSFVHAVLDDEVALIKAINNKETSIEDIEKTNQNFNDLIKNILERERKQELSSSKKFLETKRIKNFLIEKYGLPPIEANKKAKFIVDFQLNDLQDKIVQLNDSNFQILNKLIFLKQNIYNSSYAIEAIVRIVKALKYYSHLDQSEKVVADIKEGIENTLVILHNQLKNRFEVELDLDDVPPMECIVGELNQIWTNLISNCMHAIEGKGIIKIALRMVYLTKHIDSSNIYSEDEIRPIESLEKTEHIYQKIVIEDNGPGIPEEIQDKIFDPFFTTKQPGQGTGLGLGIVKNIIEKHNGFISLFSKKGETRFSIYLKYN